MQIYYEGSVLKSIENEGYMMKQLLMMRLEH